MMQSYRHYKGGTYTLLWLARLSEDREQRVVVYVSHETSAIWVRPLEMFIEPVQWPDGLMRPRFTLLSLAPSPAAP
jgi:hypothetical protein